PINLLLCQCPPQPRDLPPSPTRRSSDLQRGGLVAHRLQQGPLLFAQPFLLQGGPHPGIEQDRVDGLGQEVLGAEADALDDVVDLDRKSTRLNSSHSQMSYAVFCLKKKNKTPGIRSHSSPKPGGRTWHRT